MEDETFVIEGYTCSVELLIQAWAVFRPVQSEGDSRKKKKPITI